MAGRIHPHRPDIRKRPKGRILTSRGPHDEVAHAPGCLLVVVRRGPTREIRVVPNRWQAVRGSGGVEPAQEAVGIARFGSRRCRSPPRSRPAPYDTKQEQSA